MSAVLVPKIEKESLLAVIASEAPAAGSENRNTIDAVGIENVCKEALDSFHAEFSSGLTAAFVKQGCCLQCFAVFAFQLGVACVNEQMLRDRLKAALVGVEDERK